jgi:hypothetical protein
MAASPLMFENPHNLRPSNSLKSRKEIHGLAVFVIHLIVEHSFQDSECLPTGHKAQILPPKEVRRDMPTRSTVASGRIKISSLWAM